MNRGEKSNGLTEAREVLETHWGWMVGYVIPGMRGQWATMVSRAVREFKGRMEAALGKVEYEMIAEPHNAGYWEAAYRRTGKDLQEKTARLVDLQATNENLVKAMDGLVRQGDGARWRIEELEREVEGLRAANELLRGLVGDRPRSTAPDVSLPKLVKCYRCGKENDEGVHEWSRMMPVTSKWLSLLDHGKVLSWYCSRECFDALYAWGAGATVAGHAASKKGEME